MKNRILLCIIISVSLSLVLHAKIGNTSFITSACAAVFKPANLEKCPDGATPDYNSCPNPAGNTLDYCVRSGDITLRLYNKLGINAPLPPEGSQIKIDLKVEPLVCDYALCFFREASRTITVTPEMASQLLYSYHEIPPVDNLLYLGCSGGKCGSDLMSAKITVTTPQSSGMTCEGTSRFGTYNYQNVPASILLDIDILCKTKPVCNQFCNIATPGACGTELVCNTVSSTCRNPNCIDSPECSCSTPTPSPSPSPSICPAPGVVPNVKINCPNCDGSITPLPSPTPTVTFPPTPTSVFTPTPIGFRECINDRDCNSSILRCIDNTCVNPSAVTPTQATTVTPTSQAVCGDRVCAPGEATTCSRDCNL